jgi:hypothetical protein
MDELIKIVQAWIDRKEADGCQGCAFIDTEEWELPCAKCKRSCKDYWRRPEE